MVIVRVYGNNDYNKNDKGNSNDNNRKHNNKMSVNFRIFYLCDGLKKRQLCRKKKKKIENLRCIYLSRTFEVTPPRH